MERIEKDTIIADILEINKGAVKVLMEAGMHCLGCPSAQGETLEEACFVHGINVDELLEKLNSEEEA
ncbi:MAG: DUF1858 domain-containing protein [Clostridia bacterium]|jgi:hydroxylamine reductase|nr:DUF1858 domain-containing protein [Clostridia bacterium]